MAHVSRGTGGTGSAVCDIAHASKYCAFEKVAFVQLLSGMHATDVKAIAEAARREVGPA